MKYTAFGGWKAGKQENILFKQDALAAEIGDQNIVNEPVIRSSFPKLSDE